MTNEIEVNEGVWEFENGLELYKDNADCKIWEVEAEDTRECEGPMLFSFDKKTVFNFWTDYPDKLTPEQIAIFKKEKPILAELKPTD